MISTIPQLFDDVALGFRSTLLLFPLLSDLFKLLLVQLLSTCLPFLQIDHLSKFIDDFQYSSKRCHISPAVLEASLAFSSTMVIAFTSQAWASIVLDRCLELFHEIVMDQAASLLESEAISI